MDDQALGRELTALTAGMDRLERRLNGGAGPLDSEGLVPIYLGDEIVSPAELSSWGEV